jgi:hypothetical protein
MSRLPIAIAAALLASSALAQSTPQTVAVVGPPTYAGRYDITTGQIIPPIAGAVQAAPDVIYRNTCLQPFPAQNFYPIGTTAPLGANARLVDDGRVPSQNSTPAGTVNTYRVTQVSVAYATTVPGTALGGTGAQFILQVFTDYDAGADPATQGAPVLNVIVTGPGTTVAGQAQGFIVDIPLPAAFQFDLVADADGTFNNTANLDTFGFAFSVPATQAAGLVTGPYLAGSTATCVEGNGTYYLNPGLANDGTGLGNVGGVTWANGAVITPLAPPTIGGQPHVGLWFEMTGDFNDCNNNDISDATDIDAGTSLDTDANGEPDECAPVVIINPYCTGATTTQGCTPLIGGSGTASASANSGFTITVTLADAQRQGLVFYGADNSGFTPLPWAAGSTSFLCVKSPTQRLPGQNTGGTLTQCNGQLQYDWNAFRAANPTAVGSPFTAGDVFYAQGWMRDPAAPKSTNLSNGLEFNLAP